MLYKNNISVKHFSLTFLQKAFLAEEKKNHFSRQQQQILTEVFVSKHVGTGTRYSRNNTDNKMHLYLQFTNNNNNNKKLQKWDSK